MGILLLAFLNGCLESPPPVAYRVSGRLFVDDQLAGKANIAFHAVDIPKLKGRCPVAMTQRDGTFEMTTYAMQDGAPVGDYKVTVTWIDENTMPEDECECLDPLQHDRLSGKYADPETTSLLVTVLPKDNYLNLVALGGRRTAPSVQKRH